jgi:hypothetical protein
MSGAAQVETRKIPSQFDDGLFYAAQVVPAPVDHPAMETTSTRAGAAAPAPAAAAAKPAGNGDEAKSADFTKRLAAELKRIASHATTIETLDNGAKVYHLAGGRQVEAAPGKSPYVIVKGDWPPAKTSSGATKPATPATPTTTTKPTTTTTPAAGTPGATAGTTTGTTGTAPGTTTGTKSGTTAGTGTTTGTTTGTGATNGDTAPFEPTSQTNP